MTTRIDCKSVSRLLSDALERDLDLQDRERLKLHFGVCEACRNVEQQMSLLHRAMKLVDADRPER